MAVEKAREAKAKRESVMKSQLREAFDKVDSDSSGQLGIDAMLSALESMDIYTPNTVEGSKVKRKVKKEAGSDNRIDFEEFEKLVASLSTAPGRGGWWDQTVSWLPFNEDARELYERQSVQIFVAAVIVGNFLAIIVEKELDPYEPQYQGHYPVWRAIDVTSSVIFTLELLLNLYGNFWRPFVANGWNYLDVPVVVVGLLTMAQVELGALAQVKILRAFRILRILKRVESLNKLVVALVHSLPGVLNAFVVMFIFMLIFAVVAVDLFRDFGAPGTYPTIQRHGPADAMWGAAPPDGLRFEERTTTVSAMTPRGFHYGQEYFGTLSRSLYTLFQVLTGESWSEAVVRPLLFGWSANGVVVGVFFTFYFCLTAIILQNVVVTVLLDNFCTQESKEEADAQNQAAAFAERLGGGLPDSPDADAAQPDGARPPTGAVATLSEEQAASLRGQAATMHAELAWASAQCQRILELLPPPVAAAQQH